MKHEIVIEPSFDKRDIDPKKNYGIGACVMTFYVKGKENVVQFVVDTGWLLPHLDDFKDKPLAMDLGYHATKAQYVDQTSCPCTLLDCGSCYYDGTTLGAQEVLRILIEQGSEAVWNCLDAVYIKRFGDE